MMDVDRKTVKRNLMNLLEMGLDIEYTEINKMVPYINESNQIIFNNKEFLYYEKDINKVINDFKNKYIDIMVNNDLYVSNVCIKNVVIKSTVGDIREFSTKYKFSYL